MSFTDWEPYFAWKPVWVDAYDQSEMKDGKLSYRKWGRVERCLHTWTDEEGNEQESWRYRLPRK